MANRKSEETKDTANPATKKGAKPVAKKAEKVESAPAAKKAEKKESAPAAKKTEKKESAPAAKKVEKKESAPAAKKAEKVESAPAAKKVEKKESAPAAKKVEKKESAPAAKKVEKTESAPAAMKAEKVESAPAAKKAEKVESAPAAKKVEKTESAPAAKKAEKKESASAAKKAEKKESAPATTKEKKADSAEKEPITVKADITVRIESAETKPPKDRKKKNRLIAIVSVAAAIVIGFTSAMLAVFWPRGGELPPKVEEPGNKDDVIIRDPADLLYQIENPIVTKVGYQAEYLGTTERTIPQEVSDGGLVADGTISKYPTYAYTLGLNDTQKRALISESWSLCTVNTRIGSDGYPKNTYNSITADGKLLLNGVDTGKTLYKHTSSVGMYGGNVADNEEAIVKRVTMNPRGYGYSVTGVYAPAGEVLKVEMSEEDMNATNGVRIHIGQALFNGKANNIWAAKNINRMPVILNTFVIDKNTATLKDGVYTAYIGSFLGGPVYVVNESVTFSVTVSGGVRYSHFILGHTTPEEFAENAKSSAPYFDLEVWDNGVLHSGPVQYAKPYSYEDLYKAAVLWDKISLVSNKVRSQGIVFLYDPFVAAGAAVAFPGQQSVNCPASWMGGSLNYNTFVNSGAWGNMHEYNHNFQGFGCGDDGEVTNNSLNLVEYSLFTKISSARQLASYGGGGLSGWNCYTSATWALQRVKDKQIQSTNGLSVYATLLHNFGQDAYMKSARGRNEDYFVNWGNNTHQNMSYFVSMIVERLSSDYSQSLNEKQKDYPMFVPVSSVFQTGRSYMYDGQKRYIETMQPYMIQYNKNFTVDLTDYRTVDGQYSSGSVILPDDFRYTVKSITQPQYGSIKKTENEGVFVYTPDKNHLRSGKIYVTLSIQHKEDAFKVDDVDLVLEFEQSHDMNKTTLERTVYTYEPNDMYTDPVEAYRNHYEGYVTRTVGDNDNRDENGKLIQNANAEIWVPTPAENAVMELRGKLYIEQAGKYRFALRGRKRAALYLSFDNGETYDLAVDMKENTSSANFLLNNPENYYDRDNLKAGQWVYFKAVLPVTYAGSFVGVGMGEFENPGGVIEDDEEASSVTREVGVETVNVTYANAYRCSYEMTNTGFTSDYFYRREYKETYESSVGKLPDLKIANVEDNSPCDEKYPIENMIDGDDTTFCSSTDIVSAANPWQITVDLGKEVAANRFELTGHIMGAKNQTPNSITLYVGETLGAMQEVASFDNGKVSGSLLAFNFEEKSFRYYKLVVRKTVEGRYMAISKIAFKYNLPNGTLIGPDDTALEYRGSWRQQNMYSQFGHINIGKNGSVSFEFTGTHIAVRSLLSKEYVFEVEIDGMPAESILKSTAESGIGYSFLSALLKNTTHTVVIKSKNTFNIESIVVW